MSESTEQGLSPETMREIQMHTEIGEYICSEWSGAYDLINKLAEVILKPQNAEITTLHKDVEALELALKAANAQIVELMK